jgi:hypothetical protein
MASGSSSSTPSNGNEAVLGRLLLLFGAYAPVALIVGARVVPACVGFVAVGIGAIGILIWVLFLLWVPHGQPRAIRASETEPIDTEVTAYIVSLLLPIVAAGKPDAGDLVAYGLCALLILYIAYVSDLAAFNPFVYMFGYRVARTKIDGRPTTVLITDATEASGDVDVVKAIGVMVILGKAQKTGES